ncbi:37S ribosomal protein S22 [Nannizzia gypsea CBS 118893]|uniref:37S ribosomal protein S22 n=1 Tax=Arthroderma gypseum (strain ATCC MYA-4604 / CBS 118893) TaxID=535722 RepID=E5R084_ARTGP|nr:S-adenosylmethionine-dependent methyltransferase superfamily domain-containing protein [Nannizzia gypsea CBS 118893]EFQ97495.1 37S ribosomal protein S22 [Nannizzia gypsea CBS 118893]
MISQRTARTVRAACAQTSLRTYRHGLSKYLPLHSYNLQNARAISTASQFMTSGVLLAKQPHTPSISLQSPINSSQRLNSTSTNPSSPTQKEEFYRLLDKIYANHEELVQQIDELELEDLPESATNEDLDLIKSISSIVGYRTPEALEAEVRAVWEKHGVFVPPDELHEDGLKLYRRLYGEPVFTKPEEPQKEEDQIFKENKDGEWEEVELGQDHLSTEPQAAESEYLVGISETAGHEVDAQTTERSRQVAASLGAELFTEPPTFDSEDPFVRSHPFVDEGKFGTSPSSVTAPAASMMRPITQMTAAFSNKHISETAHKIFGGDQLPDAIRVLKSLPKNAIPLTASQKQMSPIESALFMSVLYPGIYASVLSALVETRKRLGTKWIRGLMCKEGGPSILDASGGGAGVFAWREVLRSEWSLMYPDHPEGSLATGKSTVLTGSDTLRHRVSSLLENTTFLPRLPNYLRLEGESSLGPQKPGNRKNYDIIVAPHSLLNFEEDFQKRDYVQNLWSMLNPEGGILILLEKGHKEGFAAIGGARAMILERLIKSPKAPEGSDSAWETQHGQVEKSKGMIVAPCTTHSRCPMYVEPGTMKNPKQFCRFAQRYVRPHVLQRILGNPSHNHEDAEFSYLAVQRGIDRREIDGLVQDEHTTNAAFAGYEHSTDVEETSAGGAGNNVIDPLSWPRVVLPPIKRKGHVSMDLCTPEGKIERWTVPRSFSKQAYRDARKSSWGDLWPLGAKTRIHRPVRAIKIEEATPVKKRIVKPGADSRRRRAALEDDSEEFELDEEQEEKKLADRVASYHDRRITGKTKKENKVPKWARQMEVKRDRKYGKQLGRE